MLSGEEKTWLKDIKNLVTELSQQGLEEFEVVQDSTRVYIRWESSQSLSNGKRGDSATLPEVVVEKDLQYVRAPFSGIVYLRPSPRENFFVQEGDMVEAGQVVALIEAMKLFNEIRSEFSGKVVRVAVESGQLVEAGQILLEIQGVGT